MNKIEIFKLGIFFKLKMQQAEKFSVKTLMIDWLGYNQYMSYLYNSYGLKHCTLQW